MTRTAEIARETGETALSVALSLDGSGLGTRSTGIGFFDHLLDSLARHAGLDLQVEARGDLETGAHHTVEDTGIAIGLAIDDALGDRSRIARFGHAVVPMDEARASAAIDVSGRPYVSFQASFPESSVGDFDTDLAEEFFRALSNQAKLTLHLHVESGSNGHHMVEVAFKAFARALRQAVAIDPRETGIPSTKGLL